MYLRSTVYFIIIKLFLSHFFQKQKSTQVIQQVKRQKATIKYNIRELINLGRSMRIRASLKSNLFQFNKNAIGYNSRYYATSQIFSPAAGFRPGV
jgi:hypothetical protein